MSLIFLCSVDRQTMVCSYGIRKLELGFGCRVGEFWIYQLIVMCVPYINLGLGNKNTVINIKLSDKSSNHQVSSKKFIKVLKDFCIVPANELLRCLTHWTECHHMTHMCVCLVSVGLHFPQLGLGGACRLPNALLSPLHPSTYWFLGPLDPEAFKRLVAFPGFFRAGHGCSLSIHLSEVSTFSDIFAHWMPVNDPNCYSCYMAHSLHVGCFPLCVQYTVH